MGVTRVSLVYFSPTGTSKKIAEAIARGFGLEHSHIDLTPPGSEGRRFTSDEFAIIATPVYGGRAPATAAERLRRLEGVATPAAVVAVYGNRAYEDALLELRNFAAEMGFRPVAAAVFIGEHSYDTPETPIATGRPDEEDLMKAMEFGAKIKAKLDGSTVMDEPAVPGNRPYRERRAGPLRSPETDADTCILCGACAGVCPTGAVKVSNRVETEKTGCISCTACVKSCPTGARRWEDEGVKRVAAWLYDNYCARREPEVFL
jgi:ferredoxin/menaquinone-dependent protoporphyrinogen IX oxidase